MNNLLINTSIEPINDGMGSITLIRMYVFGQEYRDHATDKKINLKKQILIINHITDQRYAASSISTHDQQQVECEAASLLPLKTQKIYGI